MLCARTNLKTTISLTFKIEDDKVKYHEAPPRSKNSELWSGAECVRVLENMEIFGVLKWNFHVWKVLKKSTGFLKKVKSPGNMELSIESNWSLEITREIKGSQVPA